MSQLINILVTNRGPLLEALKTPTSYGFDVEDIVSPITFNAVTNKSLFVARTNKGGLHDDKNGSKINYATAETLAAITAKSPLLLLLTVVSRRGVDKNNEEYVFVSSKITESLTPISVGVGTRFYYIEDGDNLPVEYVVAETVAQIVAQSSSVSMTIQDDGTDMPQEDKLNFVGYTVEDNPGNNSTDIIAVKLIEYADLETLRAAGNLPLGAQYLITDRGDAGIIVDVSSPDRISLRAKGLFLVPDFQNVGTYNTTPLLVGANHGVWSLVRQTSIPYANGGIVFWNGIMYQVTDDSAFDSNSPDLNAFAYTVLSKNTNNGYILEADAIMYDFINDSIKEREDKRSNIVGSVGTNFQWGNDEVTENKDLFSSFVCVNQKGVLSKNNNESTGVITISETFINNIYQCYFGNMSIVTFDDTTAALITDCVFNNKSAITVSTTNNFSAKEINAIHSTFNSDLDMSDVAVFSANVLTIPAELNYIGEFTLVANTSQTINKIVNLSSVHRITRFKVDSGLDQNFQHTAVATATADLLNSDSATTNNIVGRPDASDFIEYERNGNKNIRTNIVKLA